MTSSSSSHCKAIFGQLKSSDKWTFGRDVEPEDYPEWLKEKIDEADGEINLNEKTELTPDEIREEFVRKLQTGKIDSY